MGLIYFQATLSLGLLSNEYLHFFVFFIFCVLYMAKLKINETNNCVVQLFIT